jgi:hypothetical protein
MCFGATTWDAHMTDDTNYTILDDDDEPLVLAGDVTVRPRSRELAIAVGLMGLGGAVIALAGLCAIAQASVFSGEGVFSKGKAWLAAMTLPLSIVGSLLVVAGVLVGMARYWVLGRDTAAAPVSAEPGDGRDVDVDVSGA